MVYANSKDSGEIHTVSPEPMLFTHVKDMPRGNFSQRTRHGLAKGSGMFFSR